MDPAIKEGAPVGYYDDDRPVSSEPGSLPPEVQAPLLPFRGREPDAPAWFLDAIAQEPERSFVTSKGSKLELLTWGEVGKPGLLLVHGNSAHADWWSFIAPYLATEYRVASMSLAGMGASDWRETYAFQDFAEDAEACAQAAGLYAAGKPVYIGHSFGGSGVLRRRGASRADESRDHGRRRLRRSAAGQPRRQAHAGGAGQAGRQHPDPGPRPEGLSEHPGGAGPLPVHAAAGGWQPVHRRLHRPPLAEARADGGRLGRGLDLGGSTPTCGTSSTARR